MKYFDNQKRSLVSIAIFVACVTVSALLFVPFLQIQQLIMTRIQEENDDGISGSYYHAAFAYHGKEISAIHFISFGIIEVCYDLYIILGL
jgi:hypothetical protein